MFLVPTCSFRIIGLTDEEVTHLIDKYLGGIAHRKGSDHKDRSRKLLRVIVDANTNSELLLKLLCNSPKDVYYDFFVSVSSSEESVVVEIPEFVLLLREKVGGKFCFSYTCV